MRYVYTESREICTYGYGSVKGNRRKTWKFVLTVAEGQASASVERRHALLYAPWRSPMSVSCMRWVWACLQQDGEGVII